MPLTTSHYRFLGKDAAGGGAPSAPGAAESADDEMEEGALEADGPLTAHSGDGMDEGLTPAVTDRQDADIEKYAPGQSRNPAGQTGGGQFAASSGSSSSSQQKPGQKPLDAHQKHLAHLQHLATHGTPAQQRSAKAALARMGGKPRTTARTTATNPEGAADVRDEEATEDAAASKPQKAPSKAPAPVPLPKPTAHRLHEEHLAHLHQEHLAHGAHLAAQRKSGEDMAVSKMLITEGHAADSPGNGPFSGSGSGPFLNSIAATAVDQASIDAATCHCGPAMVDAMGKSLSSDLGWADQNRGADLVSGGDSPGNSPVPGGPPRHPRSGRYQNVNEIAAGQRVSPVMANGTDPHDPGRVDTHHNLQPYPAMIQLPSIATVDGDGPIASSIRNNPGRVQLQLIDAAGAGSPTLNGQLSQPATGNLAYDRGDRSGRATPSIPAGICTTTNPPSVS